MNQHPETTADLATLLRWAKRGRGWAFRERPPQFKRLAGGCVLVVVVPTLWRGVIRPRQKPECPPIDFAKAKARRVLAEAHKRSPSVRRIDVERDNLQA